MNSDLSNKFKYFNDLDDDLKNLILSKIRKPQNKDLLNDIINYKKQKDIIYDKYLANGFEYTDDYTDDFNIHGWIENDLLGYYNNNLAYIENITECNINKLSRQLSFKIKKNIKGETNAVYNFHLNTNIDIKSRINRYIGNLTIDERNNFINNINN